MKFIVKVRLIEKRVNSQAGSVYDNQNRTVGSTLRMESTERPKMPNVDDGAGSAALIAARDVWKASGALEMTAAELFTSDVTASDATMIERVLRNGGVASPSKLRDHAELFADPPIYPQQSQSRIRPMVLRSRARLGKPQTHWVRG